MYFLCCFKPKMLYFTEHFLLITYLLSFCVTIIFFMFFFPIKITTSIKTYSCIHKRKMYQVCCFSATSSLLKKDQVFNSHSWWSYKISSNFRHCSIFYEHSQEHCSVVTEIPNWWHSTFRTLSVSSVSHRIIQISFFSFLLSKLCFEHVLLYLMKTHEKSV